MSDFKAALPQVIKWSTGENKYDQTGKSPISISLFVPVESAFAFAQYVLNMADDETRHKTGKIWDYSSNCEIEVQGFYINGKGRDGQGGTSYGNINPQSTKWQQGASEQEIPF